MSHVTRRSALLGAGVALTTASCGGDERGARSSRAPEPSDRPARSRRARPLTVLQTASEQRNTAQSLRRLESHPMFALFVARGASGQPLVGRNFDWDPNPAAVVRSRVRGGRRGPAARRPWTPAGRGISVQGLVLDHARTVSQAVALMRRYDLDFSGGPPLHYLIADRSGDSAVVEIHRGALTRVPPLRGERWQVLENFHLSGVPTAQRGSFARYSTCARALE